jgi:isoquinoline 1-oxidoreductase alpha subunit
MAFRLNINGAVREADVPGEMPLLWVLRDELGMVGTKFGCGAGLCGACTVHIDGAAQRSCQTPVSQVGAAKVTTIEHIGTTAIGAKLQEAWLEIDVMQCGYCQAGQIMSASALLGSTPKPSTTQIEEAMSGNICRCACYNRIHDAIRIAAGMTEANHAA